MTYQNAKIMKEMIQYWKKRSMESELPGLFILTNYDNMKGRFKEDNYFVYQPSYSAWSVRSRWENRFERYLKIKPRLDSPVKYLYDYNQVWEKILAFSKKKPDIIQGAFVRYDDTPRRGSKALIIRCENVDIFYDGLRKLYNNCISNDQDILLLTAWNEWGEGAYLEPDTDTMFKYLDAVKRIKEESNSI